MRQRGMASVELAILVPIFGLLLAGLIGGWRIGWARAQVVDAAAAGARAASIPAVAAEARQLSISAIQSDLATVGLHCASLQVDVDTSAYALPPGAPGEVTAHVTCQLNLSDLIAPGLPGATVISSAASEPLDIFRERTP
ncbi:TadE/TadG family type IV pilus assembly protein [Brooklawnia sp.]|uniref:TadE/TadG family type IV pilus assembly protein n=1 Tax=Brooklawnia sp. TaxID=2699740 RepID=UPI003C78DF10